jgi:hypothetical protein
MRNPNYRYEENINPSVGGWYVYGPDGTMALGKTKAAARSRLLRVLRHNAKVTATQVSQEEDND